MRRYTVNREEDNNGLVSVNVAKFSDEPKISRKEVKGSELCKAELRIQKIS